MNISINGLNNTISHMKMLNDNLLYKTSTLVAHLIQAGYEIANYRFGIAQYDGTNDVSLSMSFSGNTATLTASGQSVLFIEFGSGITFTEENPKAVELGFIRGTYGKGKGSNFNWVYIGDKGSNGEVIRTTVDGETVVRTKGNPPANAMYEASKTARQIIISEVKEVLFSDRY